jgi:flagellar hook protein FlgE
MFVSGVSGIRAAADNLAKNASAIAHQSVVDYQDSVKFSSAGRALAAQSQSALTADEPQPSLERSLVGEMVAKHDLTANVTSLRTADEVLQKLVRLGEKRG